MALRKIDEFGAKLIEHVRDETISDCDADARLKKSPVGRRWAAAADMEALLEMVIPDVVDDTIFHLLHAIDNGLIEVSFKSRDGSTVDLTDGGEGGGELAGWYMGDNETAWRNRFSTKRFTKLP